jgi:hypothetical protein
LKQFNRYVFAHPDILDGLPAKAAIVLLDADDEEFNRQNIELAKSNRYPEEVPLVYVRMAKQVKVVQQVEWTPTIMPAPFAA